MYTIENRELRSHLCEYLQDFITPERDVRLREVLANRTRHITIAIEDLFQTQNISAVMRTCECYGVQDVHVIENENEFQIHSAISMGSNKWLTLHHYKNAEHNTAECIRNLKAKGYTVVATLPNDDSCYLEELPVETPTAFLFGTELTGLSDEAISLCDRGVKIPMYGFTESFNISNSAAITLSSLIERLHKSSVDWHLNEIEKEELYFEWLQKSIRNVDFIIDKFLKDNKLQ
ncbi:MAG: RNA methyltransferase [Bacteroidales bacterium]|nr:RNA methyltransferase [Bacteroidales bacterium]